MRAVQQRPQRACAATGQRADQVVQANAVCAAPRDEDVLHHPLFFDAALVILIPIPVQPQHLLRGVFNVQDVGCGSPVCKRVILNFEVHIAQINLPQPLIVVSRRIFLITLNLVTGALCQRCLRHARRIGRQIQVPVQAGFNPLVVLVCADPLTVCDAVRAVEVGLRVRKENVINVHNLSAWALQRSIPPPALVLTAA